MPQPLLPTAPLRAWATLVPGRGGQGASPGPGPAAGAAAAVAQAVTWEAASWVPGGLCVPLRCWRSPGEGYGKAGSHGLGCSPAGKRVGPSSPHHTAREDEEEEEETATSIQPGLLCKARPSSPAAPRSPLGSLPSSESSLPPPANSAQALPSLSEQTPSPAPEAPSLLAEEKAAVEALTDQKDEICSSTSSAALRTWTQFCQLTQL